MNYLLIQTFGGMKRWGLRSYFPSEIHQTSCEAERLNYHLNPNVLYRLLVAGVFVYCNFSINLLLLYCLLVRWLGSSFDVFCLAFALAKNANVLPNAVAISLF